MISRLPNACSTARNSSRGPELALAAEKDPADQEAPKGDLPADHPLRAEKLGVIAPGIAQHKYLSQFQK